MKDIDSEFYILKEKVSDLLIALSEGLNEDILKY
jgi:hypothetical protein